eukprot:5621798-Alexandrium_andersonii.AAC.1
MCIRDSPRSDPQPPRSASPTGPPRPQGPRWGWAPAGARCRARAGTMYHSAAPMSSGAGSPHDRPAAGARCAERRPR